MVTRYGQADVPREVSGRGGPAVRPAAADFPRDVCLTVSRNHAVFLLYCIVFSALITTVVTLAWLIILIAPNHWIWRPWNQLTSKRRSQELAEFFLIAWQHYKSLFRKWRGIHLGRHSKCFWTVFPTPNNMTLFPVTFNVQLPLVVLPEGIVFT